MRRAGPRPRLVAIAVVVAATLGALLAILQGPSKQHHAALRPGPTVPARAATR